MIDSAPPQHRSILRTMHARSAIMVNARQTRPAPRRALPANCWSGCHFLSIFADHLPCRACAAVAPDAMPKPSCYKRAGGAGGSSNDAQCFRCGRFDRRHPCNTSPGAGPRSSTPRPRRAGRRGEERVRRDRIHGVCGCRRGDQARAERRPGAELSQIVRARDYHRRTARSSAAKFPATAAI